MTVEQIPVAQTAIKAQGLRRWTIDRKVESSSVRPYNKPHLLFDVLELLLELLHVGVDVGVVLVPLQRRDVSAGCNANTRRRWELDHADATRCVRWLLNHWASNKNHGQSGTLTGILSRFCLKTQMITLEGCYEEGS